LVLTHDFATMVDFAYGRVADGLEMPALSPSRKIWGLAKP
jgi:hypothetical protein